MAPNNGLLPPRPSRRAEASPSPVVAGAGMTTVLRAGTVEARGTGTRSVTVADEIREFLSGEGRLSARAEVRGFFTVWTFVTRLPGPTWVDHHPGYLMRGMAYFPAAGCLIGGFVCVWYDLAVAACGLPLRVASAAAEGASLWVTGCFHEDGLADSADGIGGGWTREQILRIMTDTRLGTYGCAVLLLYVAAKMELTASLGGSVWEVGACRGGGPAIVVTHSLARLTSPILIRTHDYVDESGPKSRFYGFFVEARRLVTWHRVIFALASSFALANAFYGVEMAFMLIACVIFAAFFSGRYAEYLLGGVMGDYLGGTICVTEIALLTLLLLIQGNGGSRFAITLRCAAELLLVAARGEAEISVNTRCADDAGPAAVIRFAAVLLFTFVWCSCVGHPPVFVRGPRKVYDEASDTVVDSQQKTPLPRAHDLAVAFSDSTASFATRYAAARLRLDALAKPAGSLGTLEDWAARVAALSRNPAPCISVTSCILFAGDHGVAADEASGGEGCSLYPQAVTRHVLAGLEAGVAGASVLARAVGASLRVVDVGTAVDEPTGREKVVGRSPRRLVGGTRNFCAGDAMTEEEASRLILSGREEVRACIEQDCPDVLVVGEVGIGNTTASSALIAALTGADVQTLCGSGATTSRDHRDADAVAKKIAIVEKALRTHKALRSDSPKEALRKLGGAEIAAIVGALLEAADADLPVLIDGFIVSTAAAVACALEPAAAGVMLFATRSTEPGQVAALRLIEAAADRCGLPPPARPALDMDLRMGEGTGALLALPLLRGAASTISEMATLEEVLALELQRPDSRAAKNNDMLGSS